MSYQRNYFIVTLDRLEVERLSVNTFKRYPPDG